MNFKNELLKPHELFGLKSFNNTGLNLFFKKKVIVSVFKRLRLSTSRNPYLLET